MDTLRTEEEQIAALKNWWKENGNSLLIGVGAALLIVFGWQAYQKNIIAEKTEASNLYQQLMTAATQPLGGEEESSTVTYLAGELKEKFADTEYGNYAALFLAREAVSKGELDSAIEQLNWVKSNSEDVRIQHIVNGRIARILSSQNKNDEALALLEATDPAFESSFLEIKGDIFKRQGKDTEAVDAYKKAFALVKDNPQSQPLLAAKLSDLGVNPGSL